MKIDDLLNPVSLDMPRRRSSHKRKRLTRRTHESELGVGNSHQKLIKDAPVFIKNIPRGIVNFPPHEASNERIVQEHRVFKIYPAGQIAEYPRHIPYSSDKIGFQRKLGRDAFEVFQYTFKMPEGGKDWTVMWDYNIGLVRITPFFKSLKQPKTVAGKVLEQNTGLKDLSYNVTGGALAAQGYWVPFEAAKALAATFCYKIRFALTPVFGEDFPLTCTDPEDPIFGRMMIDLSIIRQHKIEANERQSNSNNSRITYRSKRGNVTGGTISPTSEMAAPVKILRPRLLKTCKESKDQKSEGGRTVEDYRPTVSKKSDIGLTAANRSITSPARKAKYNATAQKSSPKGGIHVISEPFQSAKLPSSRLGTKRRIILEESDDENDIALQRNNAGKQRRFDVFGAEEAHAAYGLLEMAVGRRSFPHNSGTAEVVQHDD